MSNQKEVICPYCPNGVVMYKGYKNYQCPCCHSTTPDIFWFDEIDRMSEDERANFAYQLAITRYRGNTA